MTVAVDRTLSVAIRPLHAFLLGGTVTLFIAALLSDWAYSATYEIQWNNFASWLITGALVVSALAVVWSLVDLAGRTYRGSWLYPALIVVTWILGFINALIHARDAYASMPTGLILSVVVALLACAAAWAASVRIRAGGVS